MYNSPYKYIILDRHHHYSFIAEDRNKYISEDNNIKLNFVLKFAESLTNHECFCVST